MPPGMRSYWDPKNDARFKMYTAEYWAQSRKVYAKYLELTGAMRRAGVESSRRYRQHAQDQCRDHGWQAAHPT